MDYVSDYRSSFILPIDFDTEYNHVARFAEECVTEHQAAGRAAKSYLDLVKYGEYLGIATQQSPISGGNIVSAMIVIRREREGSSVEIEASNAAGKDTFDKWVRVAGGKSCGVSHRSW